MPDNPLLTIIVPAYNERERIGETLIDLDRYLNERGIDSEILVVDDGSSDDTVKFVEGMGVERLRVIRNGSNRGKGYSVRSGLAASRGEYSVFMDADGSIALDAIGDFLEVMRGGVGMIVASRYLFDSVVPVPLGPWRKFTSVCFRIYVLILFRLGLKDTQCGFKMFNRKLVELISKFAKEDGFIFDVEFCYIARRHGLVITERAVTCTEQAGSKLNLINGPIKMSIDLLRLRFRTLFSRKY